MSRAITWMVLATAALRLAVALFSPVLSQEAYYAEYAEHLDGSYLDHPPMTAWSIRAGQLLFGRTNLGLRLVAFGFSVGTVLLGLALLRRWHGGESAARLWVIASVAVPLFAASGVLSMTEGPLLFFWMLALFALWRARDGGLRWWSLAGLGLGGALLSKYTALFLGLGGGLVLLADPQLRRQLVRPGPWLALLVAAICFSPVVKWNADNGWASFLFHAAGRRIEAEPVAKWTVQLVLGQIGALGPIVAASIVSAGVWVTRSWRRDVPARWVLAFGIPLPVLMLAQSPWRHVKVNWLAPAYLALGIAAILWWTETSAASRHPRVAAAGRVLFVGFAGVFLLAPLAHVAPWSWSNRWSGWEDVAGNVEYWVESLGGKEDVFVFTTGHRESAHLSRELRRRHDGSLPAVVLSGNVYGNEALAYDFWDRPEDQIGKDAVLVIRRRPRRDDERELRLVRARFAEVELAQDLDVLRWGVTVQRARIWVCRDYRGPLRGP